MKNVRMELSTTKAKGFLKDINEKKHSHEATHTH